MNFSMDTRSTEYESVDACVNELRTDLLPELRHTRGFMERYGCNRTPELDRMYRDVVRMIDMLEDEAKFRTMLHEYTQPDGRVVFRWAEDAWQHVQKEMRGAR